MPEASVHGMMKGPVRETPPASGRIFRISGESRLILRHNRGRIEVLGRMATVARAPDFYEVDL